MGRIAGIAAGLALWLGACAGRQPAPESPPRSVALPPQPTTASPAPLAPSEASTPGTRELVRELEQAERSAEPTQRWNETRRILAAIRALSWTSRARGISRADACSASSATPAR